jgi:hypothetical protein
MPDKFYGCALAGGRDCCSVEQPEQRAPARTAWNSPPAKQARLFSEQGYVDLH